MARGLALALVALLVAAAPAGAANKSATCADLQTVLNGAADGDVITLNSSDGVGGVCHGHYDLKSFPDPGSGGNFAAWQLQGDPTNGIDGFTGADLTGSQRMLTGVDVHRFELWNLTFRDGNVTGDGGALDVTGQSSLGLRLSEFYNNHATGKGGAVHLSQEAPANVTLANLVEINSVSALGGFGFSGDTFGSETDASKGNSAATGGAVSIESEGAGNNNSGINGSTFGNNIAKGNGGGFDYAIPANSAENFSLDGNLVVKNKAGGSGGGGHVVVANSFLNIDNERYENNSVEPMAGGPAGEAHLGGGLYVRSDLTLGGGAPQVRHSTFKGNTVAAFADGDSGGGGLAFLGNSLNVSSEFSRIEGNSVAGQPDADFDSEGGGLFIEGAGNRYYGFLDAIAGNSVGARGKGGGVYTGAPTDSTLEFGEATVAGNSVGSGGQFSGVAGGGSDALILRNSVVYNGSGDIGGFSSFDVQYSDACNDGPTPFTGPGNICADPLLAGGTNVHETGASPTIDKGSDELFNAEGGERPFTDYEGDLRPTDGDGDGHTVDMGADESPAFVAPPPPPPHVAQCSDGADNDGDGAIDSADPGCLAGPTDNNEGDETPGDLVLCGQRKISLVRADVKGSKVVLSGIVATSLAGQKVNLWVRYLGKRGKPQKLGSVTQGAGGQFEARVKKPAKSLFNLARYSAQVGNAKSVELKLPQSLASTSLKHVGATLELRGQVDRTVLGKRNPVVIKRILCGKYSVVGQAKPNKKGAYVVRFPAPQAQGSALYRAETKVLARPGSKRYVKQFARAIGITF